MEFFQIPLQDHQDSEPKFILFRPLLGIAFIGNQQMAEFARECLAENHLGGNKHGKDEISTFLETIGFLELDPPPPNTPNNGLFSPTHAVLLLTNRCQMRCIYCYASGGELPFEELSLATAKKAIDIVYDNALAQDQPTFSLSFHGGGEPIMAWDLIKACTAYAREKDLPVRTSLTSNGVWTDEQCKWIIKNIHGISLSMDGHPAVQNHNRPLANGAPSSPILEKTIHQLALNQKDYGIRMTAIPPWSDLPKSVDYLLKNTHCKGIQVEPAFNTKRGEHKLPNKKEAQQFIDAFMQAYTIASQYGRNFRYSAARVTNPVRTFCTAPYNTLIVNPQDEVVACYEMTHPDHELAHLMRYGTIDSTGLKIDIEKRQALIDLLDHNHEKCRGCFCYWSCAGDCFARTIKKTVTYTYIKDYARCEINQILTKELLLRKIAEGDGVAHLYRQAKKV